jgi:hypothetical protein
MSRQNKVNPGMYTHRGRLTQDDAARELRKQNALGSPHTWQPVKKNAMPRPARAGDADRGTETAADDAGQEETSPTVETRPASRVTKKKTAAKAAPAKLSKTVKSNTATKAVGKAKAAKGAKPAAKRAVRKMAQKAVTARNVGGAGPKSRSTTKRRTS